MNTGPQPIPISTWPNAAVAKPSARPQAPRAGPATPNSTLTVRRGPSGRARRRSGSAPRRRPRTTPRTARPAGRVEGEVTRDLGCHDRERGAEELAQHIGAGQHGRSLGSAAIGRPAHQARPAPAGTVAPRPPAWPWSAPCRRREAPRAAPPPRTTRHGRAGRPAAQAQAVQQPAGPAALLEQQQEQESHGAYSAKLPCRADVALQQRSPPSPMSTRRPRRSRMTRKVRNK